MYFTSKFCYFLFKKLSKFVSDLRHEVISILPSWAGNYCNCSFNVCCTKLQCKFLLQVLHSSHKIFKHFNKTVPWWTKQKIIS